MTSVRWNDERAMRRALELALQGAGETAPNPMVGCTIVRGGRLVGEGGHARVGGPHAEVVALERAGRRARGASAYVNLEPCCHQGRTPPCAPRLVQAGVARVVVAMRDPNPLVNGRGLAWLRRSGLRVECGLLARPARVLNERFVVAARSERPFVLLKAALTLDGAIATAAGDSKWITSAAQRGRARLLRRLHDGVLVGIGTVLADDPLLLPSPRLKRRFHRIVLDSGLSLPPGSRLARSVRQGPVWVFCSRAHPRRRTVLERAGVRVLCASDDGLGRSPGRVPLEWVLTRLRGAGLWSVMVEGGSEVLGSFLAARAFDQVALFRAPRLLGGRGSRRAFGGDNQARIAQATALTPSSPLAGRDTWASGLTPWLGSPPLFEVWYPRSQET